MKLFQLKKKYQSIFVSFVLIYVVLLCFTNVAARMGEGLHIFAAILAIIFLGSLFIRK